MLAPQQMPHTTPEIVERYYVTTLSNFARGYDKYSRCYTKAGIPESTYPDRFYLVSIHDLHIGIEKASHLLEKLNLPDDKLLVLKTSVSEHEIYPNIRNGLGCFVNCNSIHIESVYFVEPLDALEPVRVEEVYAMSLAILHDLNKHYDLLRPRSISILPIAFGCQAACPFCFSKASASVDQENGKPDWEHINNALILAKQRGAERAVITGGGEPGLLPSHRLKRLIKMAASFYPKVVLITNGYKWAAMSEESRFEELRRLDDTGLSVMAVSRHHYDNTINSRIMNLNTGSEKIAHSWKRQAHMFKQLTLRWVCVLQKGGIENMASLEAYLNWVVETGVQEVCFKELYVSTSIESEYHSYEANKWSYQHQVPVSLVLDFAKDNGWQKTAELPWGAPVFEGEWKGKPLRIAAYTEPSLYWEYHYGLSRSWNIMADGRVLASLEDRHSEIHLP